jgi:hypothetical protein
MKYRTPATSSTFDISGVSSPLDSLVVDDSFMLQMNNSAKMIDHRKSAKRYS